MNTIAVDQNGPALLKIFKARQRTYAIATRIQVTQLIATVLLPVIGAVLGTLYEPARPWVAFYGILVAVLDVLWLDRVQRKKLKIAAKIAEQFDCAVLKLPWNSFAASKPIDAEDIDGLARKWSGDEALIKNWYGAVPARATLALARVACQRTNLWYDSALRRRYGHVLVVLVAVVCVGVLLLAAAKGLSVLELAAVAATISPAILWATREYFRQSDAADALEVIKVEAEGVFDLTKRGLCDDAECLRRSREFQDAIFLRRATNPLILPFIYNLMRTEMEKQMEAGITAHLSEDQNSS